MRLAREHLLTVGRHFEHDGVDVAQLSQVAAANQLTEMRARSLLNDLIQQALCPSRSKATKIVMEINIHGDKLGPPSGAVIRQPPDEYRNVTRD